MLIVLLRTRSINSWTIGVISAHIASNKLSRITANSKNSLSTLKSLNGSLRCILYSSRSVRWRLIHTPRDTGWKSRSSPPPQISPRWTSTASRRIYNSVLFAKYVRRRVAYQRKNVDVARFYNVTYFSMMLTCELFIYFQVNVFLNPAWFVSFKAF